MQADDAKDVSILRLYITVFNIACDITTFTIVGKTEVFSNGLSVD